jgi:hypothetical protein
LVLLGLLVGIALGTARRHSKADEPEFFTACHDHITAALWADKPKVLNPKISIAPTALGRERRLPEIECDMFSQNCGCHLGECQFQERGIDPGKFSHIENDLANTPEPTGLHRVADLLEERLDQ